MVDEVVDDGYEYPEDVVEINQHRFVGIRTLILAIIALFGYIGAVYLPVLTGVTIDTEGLYNLTMMGFAFFFVKTVIPLVK
jgi:nitrate/nitrite transporter NarK